MSEKPWDETWRTNPDYPNDVFGRDGGDVLLEGVDWHSDYSTGPERARLAAAAPEMARLLLDMIDFDSQYATSYLDKGDRDRIRAVLRKAGVLSESEAKSGPTGDGPQGAAPGRSSADRPDAGTSVTSSESEPPKEK